MLGYMLCQVICISLAVTLFVMPWCLETWSLSLGCDPLSHGLSGS